MPRVKVWVTTEEVHPKAMVIPKNNYKGIVFHYELVEGDLVIRVSDVVKNADLNIAGEYAEGNTLTPEAKGIPGAIIHEGHWMAPIRELAELVAYQGGSKKATDTLVALFQMIQLEKRERERVLREQRRQEWREFDINELRKRAWESVDIKQRGL